jgi:hypothetical protein
MRSRHVRTYRALLRVYPRRFRADYAEEMCRVFAQQLHYARVTEGWPGVVRVWARSLVDLVTTAPTEHFDEDKLVASPVGASGWHPTQDASPPDRRWVLVGLGPVWALLAVLFLPGDWGNPIVLSSNPPSFLGLPPGAAFGLALGWGLIGLRALADPRTSRLRPVLIILLGLSIAAAFFGLLKLPPAFRVLAGIAPAGLAVAWRALGRPPLSDARPSSVRLATLLLFTLPATVLVLIVQTAIILVWLNLTT